VEYGNGRDIPLDTLPLYSQRKRGGEGVPTFSLGSLFGSDWSGRIQSRRAQEVKGKKGRACTISTANHSAGQRTVGEASRIHEEYIGYLTFLVASGEAWGMVIAATQLLPTSFSMLPPLTGDTPSGIMIP
jgi:hypothetical protein